MSRRTYLEEEFTNIKNTIIAILEVHNKSVAPERIYSINSIRALKCDYIKSSHRPMEIEFQIRMCEEWVKMVIKAQGGMFSVSYDSNISSLYQQYTEWIKEEISKPQTLLYKDPAFEDIKELIRNVKKVRAEQLV
ncbi:hypothetical protein [Bacillus bombysepticus]|uniref:hypothetical protein n=1 Tax=Bacillus bombysepticus TaxID=658666 RepID=UPI003019AB58